MGTAKSTSTKGRKSRTKVLLIAEAANPEWVSVPLIGWSLAVALREIADVHILTQIRNRDAFLRAGLIEGQDFTAIDSEAFARPLWKIGDKLRMGDGKGWTALQAVSALSYLYFERLVWQQFGARIKGGEFDVVHRVTPLSPTTNSPLARKCRRTGVPFVLGPLNGGVPWPDGFDRERRREREWLSYIRGIYKMLPGRRATLRNAAAVLVGSRHTMGEMPASVLKKCVYMPENGIDPARFSKTAAPAKGVMRACFIGRLVPYKGPDMLIEAAMPLLKNGSLRLDIIGDGPTMAALKTLVNDNGVAGAVHFHGWLAHDKVQDIAVQTQLLAFPSVREFGGGVVLEAMALGIPSLIVDYAGPGELVVPGTGFKVPLGTRAEIIACFSQELERLSRAPKEMQKAGDKAKTQVFDLFTWQKKAAQTNQVYDWVLSGGDDAPPVFF